MVEYTTDELRARAQRWLHHDPDPDTRAATEALLALADDEGAQELELCFGERLAFGTAGIRGLLGPGPGRMNRALVQRVTQGLADYLLATVPGARERGVVVGHDARRQSDEFAADTVAVLAGAGFRVLECAPLAPTPLVAFALNELGAAAAVVVTASHNPPEYNGYKVYWENGAQIIPPHDVGIAAAIDAVEPAGIFTVERPSPRIEDVPADLEERYLAAVAEQIEFVPAGGAARTIVYTPLHGVGAALCERAMRAQGVEIATVVEQRAPDGAFPTVRFPNPEEEGALDLALELARTVDADLVLANDPDADRLAVALRQGAGYRQLSGDELGAVLADALLEARGAEWNRASQAFVARSVVSSTLIERVAAHHGAAGFETLTGFKWLWNAALERQARGAVHVFSYEEALGYSVGPAVRDKDGISAAALVARLARDPARSLWSRLLAIWERHGHYATRQRSIVDAEPGGMERHAARLARLREGPPTALAGHRVERVQDYARPGGDLPPSNCLALHLEGGSRVMVRPSGTEPKLKIYLQAVLPWSATAPRAARARLDQLERAMLELVLGGAA